jgi:hypothetical protein
MKRTLISRGELQERALHAVQREPNCAGIMSVSLAVVEIVNDGSTNWHVQVTDPGDVSPEIAYRAAHRVKEVLARQYVLGET